MKKSDEEMPDMKKSDEEMPEDEQMPEIDLSKWRVVDRRARREHTLTLSTLRRVRGLTQVQIAQKTGRTQSEISRAEQRGDALVSTLARYAEALGGELLLFVKIGGPAGERRYPIALEGDAPARRPSNRGARTKRASRRAA